MSNFSLLISAASYLGFVGLRVRLYFVNCTYELSFLEKTVLQEPLF